MELLVFGHAGTPFLVFPTSMGRFFDYEDRGMISLLADKYEHGQLQAFCVDSVDSESWYNKSVHPRDRVLRHMQYESYLLNEVLPLIRGRNQAPLGVTGCSFGGYHSANFAFRHPELVSHMVSISGAFNIKQFLDGYYDENCYFNCPADFLPGVNDPAILDKIRRMRIILASGEHDICVAENRRLSAILSERQIPHWLDIWGDGAQHEWPVWEGQTRKFL